MVKQIIRPYLFQAPDYAPKGDGLGPWNVQKLWEILYKSNKAPKKYNKKIRTRNAKKGLFEANETAKQL